MELDETNETTIMRLQVDQSGEACMVDGERWDEIRQLFDEERESISEGRIPCPNNLARRCVS